MNALLALALDWRETLLLPLALGLVAVYCLLPRAVPFNRTIAGIAGMLAMVTAGVFLVWNRRLDIEQALFYCFAGLAVLSGAALVTQQNPVHAALSFALVVLSTCGLFLLQAAPFLMAATAIVYAGAIVVTFLFVIMLAQQAGLSSADYRSREPLLSALAGFLLLGAFLSVINQTFDVRKTTALAEELRRARDIGSVAELNQALGDPESFFARVQREAEGIRDSALRSNILAEAIEARSRWEEWKREANIGAMKEALAKLCERLDLAVSRYGLLDPEPAVVQSLSPYSRSVHRTEGANENVAPLGRALFTDYLIPVELAGTLLLVATIGAIAISARRPEGFR
jgi:NADH:ubiquinone oxidoreductase subunit 6 (subunit J)